LLPLSRRFLLTEISTVDSEQTTCTIPDGGKTMDTTLWTACLVVVRGAGTGNKFLLHKDEMSIGRADDVDVRLARAGVSRRHAVVRRGGEQRFVLADLDSTNGTYVNSSRITEATLKDQDLIGIGDSRLKFIAADSPEQPYYEELYCQAQMDKALQIYNKHYFLSRMDEELRRHQRGSTPLSLILLDVDHFKRLNDTYGHLAGDAALVHLAEVIKQHLRETDVLCRYGGEEFGIIMPQTDQQQALGVAERIRAAVAAAPVNHASTTIGMTISLGISGDSYLAESYTREVLINQADKALYQAKNQGRNRVVLFNPAMMKPSP
jgi:two-component system, cell cycle response regulator